jgi:hypothetical protein
VKPMCNTSREKTGVQREDDVTDQPGSPKGS